MNRKHFASTAAYLQWVRSLDPTGHHSTSFTSERNVQTGIDNLTGGRPDLVAEAEQQLAALMELIDTPRRTWEPSVAGAFPNVPAYLANNPQSMYTLTPSWRDDAPIRVWVGVTSSAAITSEQLLRRGVALTAFAMALGETRNVMLSPYILARSQHGSREAIISWDLATSPLVLSEVCASLADVAVIRYLGLWATDNLNDTFSPLWIHDYADPERMRSHLGCAVDDVYLGSIHYNDPLLTDPTQWIKDAVAKATGE